MHNLFTTAALSVLRAIAAMIVFVLLFRILHHYFGYTRIDPPSPHPAAPVVAIASVNALAPVQVVAPTPTAEHVPGDKSTGYDSESAGCASEVSTLVFGITPPDKDAAARAANHRGQVVRDVISATIPTRIHGNSNSHFGLMALMVPSYGATAPVVSTHFVPFGSSTHFEDARVAQSQDAEDAAKRRKVTYSAL